MSSHHAPRRSSSESAPKRNTVTANSVAAAVLPTPPAAVTTPAPVLPSPTATSLPRFAPGSQVAGIDIGGLDTATAAHKLSTALNMLYYPLELTANQTSVQLDPTDIGLEVPIDTLLTTARQQASKNQVVDIPLHISFDETRLHQFLINLANQTAITPTIDLLQSTSPLSRSFGVQPGRRIDIDLSMKRISDHLHTRNPTQTIDLPWMSYTITTSTAPVVSLSQIHQHVTALTREWNGVVGFVLHDLRSGTTVAVNEHTVFSSASVMKIAVLLHAYIRLPEFDTEQQILLRKMIVESDNLAANGILAASVGGAPTDTDAALEGTRQMNQTLQQLGFHHTYQYLPYEAYEYLVGVRGLTIPSGPPQEGSPPYTRPDEFVRTTPAEMSQILLSIDQCSRGEGVLLEQFGEQLSPQRCQEMLDLLAQNNDTQRICAGMPASTRVEHKSGWTDNTNGDVGIVRSPGGDFLLAIFVYQETDDIGQEHAAQMIAALAHIVYTAYNPVTIEL